MAVSITNCRFKFISNQTPSWLKQNWILWRLICLNTMLLKAEISFHLSNPSLFDIFLRLLHRTFQLVAVCITTVFDRFSDTNMAHYHLSITEHVLFVFAALLSSSLVRSDHRKRKWRNEMSSIQAEHSMLLGSSRQQFLSLSPKPFVSKTICISVIELYAVQLGIN